MRKEEVRKDLAPWHSGGVYGIGADPRCLLAAATPSHSEIVDRFKKILPHGDLRSFIPTAAGDLGSTNLERAVMAEELGAQASTTVP